MAMVKRSVSVLEPVSIYALQLMLKRLSCCLKFHEGHDDHFLGLIIYE